MAPTAHKIDISPLVAEIYTALEHVDVARLPGLIEVWKTTEFSEFEAGSFFMSACTNPQAPMIDILTAAGLSAPPDAFDLAISRQAWATASALLPAIAKLFLQGHTNNFRAPLLVDCILAGQHDLARNQLSLYGNQAQAASVALHGLARQEGKDQQEAVEAVSYLMKAGADANSRERGNTPILEAALVNGTPRLALALIDSGAHLDQFSNPAQKIVRCVIASQVLNEDGEYQLSGSGWRLLEVAVDEHIRLPSLVVSTWGACHFEGSPKFYRSLHPRDIDKIKALEERIRLNKETPSTSNNARSFRL